MSGTNKHGTKDMLKDGVKHLLIGIIKVISLCLSIVFALLAKLFDALAHVFGKLDHK